MFILIMEENQTFTYVLPFNPWEITKCDNSLYCFGSHLDCVDQFESRFLLPCAYGQA